MTAATRARSSSWRSIEASKNVLAAAPLLELHSQRRESGLVGGARNRSGRAGVEVLDALEDRELGSQVIHRRWILGFAA